MDAKVLLFDIETTSLKADFGFVLAIGYKWLGDKKVTILEIGDFDAKTFRAKEKALVKAFAEIYNQADLTVTHNGQRFDIPYINAKMLEHRLGILPPLPQVDTLQIARKHLRAVSRKRLDTLSYYLGTHDEKTPVEGRIWVEAAVGSKSARKYIIDHCRADVLVLEEVYLLLRPLLLGHPRVSGVGPCRYCGSFNLENRGPAYSSAKGFQQRIRCRDCGGWENRLARESEFVQTRQAEPARARRTRQSTRPRSARR